MAHNTRFELMNRTLQSHLNPTNNDSPVIFAEVENLKDLFRENGKDALYALQNALKLMGPESLRSVCEYFICVCILYGNGLSNHADVISEFVDLVKSLLSGGSMDMSSEDDSIVPEELLNNMIGGTDVSLNYNDNHENMDTECPYEKLRRKIYPDHTIVSSRDTRALPHKYITPRVFSNRAYDGFTYRERMNLGPVKMPCLDNLGWYDSKNHSFLIDVALTKREFAGRRLTITKMSQRQYYLLAMQVAAKRGSLFPSDDSRLPMDPGFMKLVQIFGGEEPKAALHGPSFLQDKQHKELLFSYIHLHILGEDDKDHQEIQRYWFFAGSYVSFTKHAGWNQHPDEPIFGLVS